MKQLANLLAIIIKMHHTDFIVVTLLRMYLSEDVIYVLVRGLVVLLCSNWMYIGSE